MILSPYMSLARMETLSHYVTGKNGNIVTVRLC